MKTLLLRLLTRSIMLIHFCSAALDQGQSNHTLQENQIHSSSASPLPIDTRTSPVPDIDKSPAPGIDTSSTPGMDISSIPGINTNTTPGINTNTTPGIDTRSTSSIDMSSTPSIDTRSTPGIDTSSNPGIDTSSTPGIDTSSTHPLLIDTRTSPAHGIDISSAPQIQRTPLPSGPFRRVNRRECSYHCRRKPKPKIFDSQGVELIEVPLPSRLGGGTRLLPKNRIMTIYVEGGEDCSEGEFPHVAALRFRNPESDVIMWNSCSGVLISRFHVLTAAHCIDGPFGPPEMVRVGALNVKQTRRRRRRQTNSTRRRLIQDIKIGTIHLHPEYKADLNLYNDIALLELKRPASFRWNIQPACLHDSEDVAETAAVATGWGNTGFTDAPSDILQKVTLDIIPNQKCRELIASDALIPEGIRKSQVCAGDLMGGHDTCTGDSGGPLQVNNSREVRPGYFCAPLIVGITSFGKYCGEKNTPGVYTRVAPYVPWIESIVWPESHEAEPVFVSDTKQYEAKTKIHDHAPKAGSIKVDTNELGMAVNRSEKPVTSGVVSSAAAAGASGDTPLFDLRRSDGKFPEVQIRGKNVPK